MACYIPGFSPEHCWLYRPIATPVKIQCHSQSGNFTYIKRMCRQEKNQKKKKKEKKREKRWKQITKIIEQQTILIKEIVIIVPGPQTLDCPDYMRIDHARQHCWSLEPDLWLLCSKKTARGTRNKPSAIFYKSVAMNIVHFYSSSLECAVKCLAI